MKAKKSPLYIVVAIVLLSLAAFVSYFSRQRIYKAVKHVSSWQVSSVSSSTIANPTKDIIQQYRNRKRLIQTQQEIAHPKPNTGANNYSQRAEVAVVSRDTRTQKLFPKVVYEAETSLMTGDSALSRLPTAISLTGRKSALQQVKRQATPPVSPSPNARMPISSRTPLPKPQTASHAPAPKDHATSNTTINLPLTFTPQSSCLHRLPGLSVTIDNIFLYHALCHLQNESDLANFRGRRNYYDTGLDFSRPHVVIHGKNKVRIILRLFSTLCRHIH